MVSVKEIVRRLKCGRSDHGRVEMGDPMTRLRILTAVAQHRPAASRTAGLCGGVGPSPKPAAVDPRISRVTALMHRAFHRKLPLRDLAGASGLSVSRLCHLFKSHTGIGAAQYLKLLRLQRAKVLLETSVLSVKEVGVRLGYEDPSRFVEDFRKTYGLTPLRHRRLAPTGWGVKAQ
jgi:transcriptional regulator GlxA family with amidase domain